MPQSIADMLKLALQHHAAERLAEAQALYRQVLDQAPHNAVALDQLGILNCQKGQLQAGTELFRQAAAADPNGANYHAHLGQALVQQKRWSEAEAACRTMWQAWCIGNSTPGTIAATSGGKHSPDRA